MHVTHIHEKLGHFGFQQTIVFSMHNIGNEGCNFKFNKKNLGVWCVIECKHQLTHLHPIYDYCQSWGLVIDEVWIL
jgi:hypothetical protein